MGHGMTSSDGEGQNLHYAQMNLRSGQTARLWFTPEQNEQLTQHAGNGHDRLIIPITAAQIDVKQSSIAPTDTFELRTGQCLMVPAEHNPDTGHCDVTGHCLVIDMAPEIRATLEAEFSRSGRANFTGPTVCRRSTELLELVRSGRRYLNIGLDQFDAVIDSIAIMVMAELLISHKNNQTVPANLLSDQALEDIQTYIDDNLEHSIVLEQLAKLCDMSVYNFSKAFKSKTGSSPYKYVTNRRISKACELLCATDNAIADVAYKVGFSSQSHMTELFRKTLGTTPARYRKQFSRLVISA